MVKIDNYDIPTHFLLNYDGSVIQANNKTSELKVAVENYRSDALKAAGNNEQLASKIKALLNTSDNVTDEIKVSWEQYNFFHSPLISTLVRLSEIEKNVSLIETEVLTLKN